MMYLFYSINSILKQILKSVTMEDILDSEASQHSTGFAKYKLIGRYLSWQADDRQSTFI